jgi:hypothetical protein|tara:strand:+ start:43 stop:1041 length:999 start_codon:yes stop_codon:yes gene_type:complete
MVKKYIDAGIELTKFLNAAKNLAKQGIKKNEVLAFAKQQFGEITDSLRKQVDDIFEKSPLAKILDRKKTAKKSVEERKVLDMEGNVIDVNKPIIGGKQTKLETSDLDDILSGVDDVDISQGMIDLDELNFTKNAMAAKKAIDEAPTPGFNVEKFIEDFPVSREEAVRISILPQKERAVILQKYIDNDMRQQIQLMDFEPPKDRDPNAMGGRIGYGSGTPSKNRFTQLMLLKEEALDKGDMDKVRQIQSDIDKEFGKAQGGRIGYKDGTENMMAEIDYSSSAYRFKLIDSLMDTGGLDYGSAVKEADRIIEIKLRPKTKKKLAAGGLPNILGY